MPWWSYVLIAIGVIALGALKLVIFNRIRQNNASKRRFTDED